MAAHIINVEPRYTSGSPASVNVDIAERVAQQEKEAYEHSLEGLSGPLDKYTAQTEGLKLIVFEMVEAPKGWWVHDWLTHEMHYWPHFEVCPRCKKKVPCKRGYLQEHGMCDVRDYKGRIADEDERHVQGRRFWKKVVS